MIIYLSDPNGIRLDTRNKYCEEYIFIIPRLTRTLSYTPATQYKFNEVINSTGAFVVDGTLDVMSMLTPNSIKGTITLNGASEVCYITPVVLDGKLQVIATTESGNSTILYDDINAGAEVNHLSGMTIVIESIGIFDTWFNTNVTPIN